MAWLGWINLGLLVIVWFALNDLKNELFQLHCDFAEFQGKSQVQSETVTHDGAEITNRLAALERCFEEHESTIAWHLECMRRLQQINDGIRELRTSTATARFSSEGESKKERSATMYMLGSIQQDIESFRLPLIDRKNLLGLSMELEDMQRIVRKATLASPALSIEQIDSEARYILSKLDGIRTEEEDATKE
jgi:hypothetical protein